jgi:hypothetical protein
MLIAVSAGRLFDPILAAVWFIRVSFPPSPALYLETLPLSVFAV